MEVLRADHAGSDADKTPFNPFDLTKVWPHRSSR